MNLPRLTPRLTRRSALGAAAAIIAGPTLAACAASSQATTATPQTAQPVETIYFQINWQQSWTKTAQTLCQQITDQVFNATHKGIRAVPLPWGNAQGVLTQVLAGDKTAPAVVSSCCGDFAVAQPMLAKLDPFLRQANMDTSVWSQGQLVTYQMPDGLYGVPAYTACQPLIYDQGAFDNLGLDYPDPAWTYTDAARIWQSLVSDKGGVHRYGTTFQFYPNNFDGQVFLQKGFGGNLMDSTKTKCLLGEPGSLAAANWIYPLVWSKVLINRGGISGMNGATAVSKGRTVMYQSAGNMLFEAVTVLGSGVKWDVIRMPAWPVQRGTNVQVDYYGINQHYPDQSLAWELFQFVAAGQDINRFLISSTLSFPNLTSMWDEWQSIVHATAPITANKHLEYWAEAAQQGYGYGHEFFLYAPNQALNAMAPTLQQLWDHKLEPAEGYPLMVQQIDALEAAAAAEVGQATTMAKVFPTANGGSIAAVTPGL